MVRSEEELRELFKDWYKPYVFIGMCGPHPRFGLPDGWKWDTKK